MRIFSTLLQIVMFFRLGFVFLLAGGRASAFRDADYKHSKQIAPALKIHWKEVSGDEIFIALETKNIGFT